MTSGALFGGASSRSQSKNLVEFRAGKMYMKGKMVHPDKRKGLVYVHQSDDSLMHFCWKDRTSGTVEDDLIIFPDDIEFKLVQQCTTGRVYVLKFKSSTKKFFFWMQEPKTDKDDDHCKKVNEYLNNPPAPGSSRGGGSGGLPADLSGESDLQNILGNMSQQQLMQLLGGLGMGGGAGGLGSLTSLIGGRPSSSQSSTSETPVRAQSSPASRTSAATATTTTADTTRPVTATGTTGQDSSSSSTATPMVTDSTSATPKPAIQLSDLQSILSNMAVPEAEVKEPINLASALNPESIIPILANADVQAQLIPFLPEGEALPKTEQELRDTVQSPQFKQALNTFGTALQSGELGPLIGQFGLGEDVTNAAAQGDLEAFVKAMQETEKKVDTDTEMKDDEKKDEEK